MLEDIIWNLFKKTGRIDVYINYKEIFETNNSNKKEEAL
ncbi:YqzL family protein [Abyssisolibacter fermentans]|nr:YqzL family protein [Abyssisolibacter fermentans]